MILINKFLILSIFIILLPRVSFGNTNDYELYEVKNYHDQFCSKLVSNITNKNIEDEWIATEKSNNYQLLINNNKKIKLKLQSFVRKKEIQKLIFTFYSLLNKPIIELRSKKNCKIKSARVLIYDKKDIPIKINSVDMSNYNILETKFLNPDLPIINNESDKNIIGLIDTGINYTIEKFEKNIATKNKKIIGYDFWDNDNKPFDSDPRQNPFYPRHHGTTVFSVLSKEAPASKIAPYRFPANDMCKFKDLIDHIAENSIKLVSLSMGSDNILDWVCFKESLEKHKDILFIVSAGNNGFNIDNKPIYPASLDLDNIITVTSSDQTGRLGRGSNYGRYSVDFILPAERVEVIDHRGVRASTGGTSYAVPRLVALISRYMNKNPNSSKDDILSFLKKRAIKKGEKITRYGWIPDPSDNYLID